MFGRMLGAARLNVDTYEEVERDGSAIVQALAVVVLVAIAGGVGTILGSVIFGGAVDLLDGLLFGVIRGIVSWGVWALIAWIVGSTILKTRDTEADWGQLARGTGFAQTPGLFNILVFIPIAGAIIAIIVFFWQVAGMMIAVRQSLDYSSTWRAFGVVIISLIPVLIINAILFWALNIGSPPAAS